MRVFMLGWEFPPFISGGLGTACYGLTKGLDHIGTEVLFVLPRGPEQLQPESARQPSAAAQPDKPTDSRRPEAFRYIRFRTIDAVIRPYVSPGVEDEPEPATAVVARRPKRTRAVAGPTEGVRVIAAQTSEGPGGHYAGDLFTEIERYAALACDIAADGRRLRPRPRPRLDDLPGRHGRAAHDRQAAGRPRPLHRVRPHRRARQPADLRHRAGRHARRHDASSASAT